MIDHDARTRLTSVILRYLAEEITAFQFDEALDEFCGSQDSAIRYVATTLWYFYDDCVDHSVVLAKVEWDYIQRLLLVLESESTVTWTRTWHWHYSQCFAAILLAACIGVAVNMEAGRYLVVAFIPFGVGSILLSGWRQSTRIDHPFQESMTPFRSLRDLRTAYEAAQFEKMRYPAKLAARTIRSPIFSGLARAYGYLWWSLLAPIPLLVQCFPVRTTQVNAEPA